MYIQKVCRPGYYGIGCGHLCNGYCMNNGVCTHVDGVCLAVCQDGYIGTYCNISCKKGYFGKNCSSVCSPHCKTCRHTDGHCSCSAGYTGYRCTTECVQSYGENCNYPCWQHCYNRNCDRYNGSCLTGCTDGFYGERCNKDDLSYNKIATQSETYNNDYNKHGASNAVDRNSAICTRTNPIGRNEPGKTVWWKVDLGGVSSIYSIHIQFKSYEGYVDRQKGRLAGFSLYVSNSDVNSLDAIKKTTLCYKDGPQLPPLNLTKKCMEYGRYVIFNNERFNGIAYPEGYEVTNVYTELCEVIIKGCSNASVYGINCDTPCPTNCKDSTCHIENGACSLCKPGWTGLDCKLKCREGWYGTNCTKQCVGHCKDEVSCNHVTGFCDRGCAAGWKGDLCDEECDDGTYGYNCINTCSDHCLNNSPCNKQIGHCDRGCEPGYTNRNCSKECLPGYFGIDCSRECSGHCIYNEPCDHVSGVCPRGCQDGFVGTHCNKACDEGYFGTNCSRVCSPNCQPGKCQHTDGSCTSCVEGWMGGNCTTACFKSYGENCRYHCSLHCYNNTCNTHNGRCLIGCKDGFYGEWCAKGNVLTIQNISSSIILAIGLSVSILINIIFTVCGILMWRRIKSSKVTLSGNLLSCWKKSLYQDIVVKNDENSTYQELDVSDSTYQNTALP